MSYIGVVILAFALLGMGNLWSMASCEIVTYKVSAGGREQVVTLNHATKLEKERYIRLIESKNPDIALSGISHF